MISKEFEELGSSNWSFNSALFLGMSDELFRVVLCYRYFSLVFVVLFFVERIIYFDYFGRTSYTTYEKLFYVFSSDI